MQEEIEHILANNIDLALAYDYKMVNYFCLRDNNGYFMIPDNKKKCHPLETIILGAEIKDCINLQISELLGVSPHWIQGFIDGYKFNFKYFDGDYYKLPFTDACKVKYMNGYQDGCDINDWIAEL